MFLTNVTARKGGGGVTEENYTARPMPVLSTQSDTTIHTKRDVRSNRAERDPDAAVPVRGLRSAVLWVCLADGLNAIPQGNVALDGRSDSASTPHPPSKRSPVLR